MLLKRVSFVIAAGIATAVGIAIGFGAVDRLLMRLVAVAEGAPVAFSWEGTVGILVAIAVFNLPAAIAFAALPRRARWVGYPLAILATAPHWINLLGTILHFGDEPGQHDVPLLVAACGIYTASIVGQVICTGRLAGWLTRRGDRFLVAVPALP